MKQYMLTLGVCLAFASSAAVAGTLVNAAPTQTLTTITAPTQANAAIIAPVIISGSSSGGYVITPVVPAPVNAIVTPPPLVSGSSSGGLVFNPIPVVIPVMPQPTVPILVNEPPAKKTCSINVDVKEGAKTVNAEFIKMCPSPPNFPDCKITKEEGQGNDKVVTMDCTCYTDKAKTKVNGQFQGTTFKISKDVTNCALKYSTVIKGCPFTGKSGNCYINGAPAPKPAPKK